jgi:hypothetical protein
MNDIKQRVLDIVEESMLALSTQVLSEEDSFREFDALYELKKALLQVEDYEVLAEFRDLEARYDVVINAHENV